MIILAVDTSAKTASVAVSKAGKILGEFFIDTGLTHSETLIPMIECLLVNVGISISQVDLFAVVTGPGSFTGVRIGVSAIQGIAFANDKKCVSVSSLEAMAYNLVDKDCIISCCMDARRGQVYNAIFENNKGRLVRIVDDRLISAENLADEICKYNKEVNFVGDGAEMCYNVIRQKFTNLDLYLVSPNFRYTKATGVILVAEKMFRCDQVLSACSLAPVYLRLSQAERELKERNKVKDGDDVCQ